MAGLVGDLGAQEDAHVLLGRGAHHRPQLRRHPLLADEERRQAGHALVALLGRDPLVPVDPVLAEVDVLHGPLLALPQRVQLAVAQQLRLAAIGRLHQARVGGGLEVGAVCAVHGADPNPDWPASQAARDRARRSAVTRTRPWGPVSTSERPGRRPSKVDRVRVLALAGGQRLAAAAERVVLPVGRAQLHRDGDERRHADRGRRDPAAAAGDQRLGGVGHLVAGAAGLVLARRLVPPLSSPVSAGSVSVAGGCVSVVAAGGLGLLGRGGVGPAVLVLVVAAAAGQRQRAGRRPHARSPARVRLTLAACRVNLARLRARRPSTWSGPRRRT